MSSAGFDPWRAGAVALDVVAAARLAPEALAERQAARLARLLRAAQSGSRFYAEALRGRDAHQVALAELPVVCKAELMARFDDWVCDPRFTLEALRRFTADPARIGEPFLDGTIVWESSGTRGEPGFFVQDAQALAVYDALEGLRRGTPRPWARLVDPMFLGERIAFVGATTGHFASQVSVQRLRRLNPWMAHAVRSFSILQRTAELVEQLNRFAPSIVTTYPTAAALLAEQARRGALHIRPQEFWTGGETLNAAVREAVEQTFGCPVRNSYGASEFLAMAWECDRGRLHLNADWLILEPVDAQHRPAPPGEWSHTVLLTNLANHLQPVIRYDLGDQVRWVDGRCRCGSHLPAIEVRGRRDDALVMAGADGGSVTLLPLALSTVLEEEAGVFDFQLRQRDAHTLELRLGQRGEAAHDAQQRCRRVLQSFAKRQGLAALNVVAVPDAPLVHGRSGKVQRVVAQPDTASAATRR